MKYCSHCSNNSCPLLRKLEKTTDLYAFLDEHYPMDIVLDNMHDVSKGSLVCTCCIFGNALKAMHRKTSWWKRLKEVFKEVIVLFFIVALFGLAFYLCIVTYMQNEHIGWIDYVIKHFLLM